MAGFKIMDGAMGSELIRRKLTLPEHVWSAEANLKKPKMVYDIHREYINAGAEYITTNTFRSTPRAYSKLYEANNDLTDNIQSAKESTYKAVELAKNAANISVKVLGSIAPLEDCYTPQLFPGRNVAISEFSQLGEWLTIAGVDIILLETMNSVAETEAALIGFENIKVPVWVSLVLKDVNHLLSGDTIIDALEIIKQYSVDCVMLNCNSLCLTLGAVDILVDNWPGKWGVYPNLGIGGPSPDGNILHYEKMDLFISTMKKIINKNPFILGACCGSSSNHLKELIKLRNKILPVRDIL